MSGRLAGLLAAALARASGQKINFLSSLAPIFDAHAPHCLRAQSGFKGAAASAASNSSFLFEVNRSQVRQGWDVDGFSSWFLFLFSFAGWFILDSGSLLSDSNLY